MAQMLPSSEGKFLSFLSSLSLSHGNKGIVRNTNRYTAKILTILVMYDPPQ